MENDRALLASSLSLKCCRALANCFNVCRLCSTANWESDEDLHQGFVAIQLEEHGAEFIVASLVIRLVVLDVIDMVRKTSSPFMFGAVFSSRSLFRSCRPQ